MVFDIASFAYQSAVVKISEANQAIGKIDALVADQNAREIASLYYRQGKLDQLTRMRFGQKLHDSMKQREREFMRGCYPELSEVQCREVWLEYHRLELNRISSERRNPPIQKA